MFNILTPVTVWINQTLVQSMQDDVLTNNLGSQIMTKLNSADFIESANYIISFASTLNALASISDVTNFDKFNIKLKNK